MKASAKYFGLAVEP